MKKEFKIEDCNKDLILNEENKNKDGAAHECVSTEYIKYSLIITMICSIFDAL